MKRLAGQAAWIMLELKSGHTRWAWRCLMTLTFALGYWLGSL